MGLEIGDRVRVNACYCEANHAGREGFVLASELRPYQHTLVIALPTPPTAELKPGETYTVEPCDPQVLEVLAP